jgi:hypothetical protein
VQRAPGIPCALFDFEGDFPEQLGHFVPRECGVTSTVIPGHRAAMNPESRDSGFDAAHRPGMTMVVLFEN